MTCQWMFRFRLGQSADRRRRLRSRPLVAEGLRLFASPALDLLTKMRPIADSALEVAPEFVRHVLGQTPARRLARVLKEALQVLLEDAIEDGRLRAALLILLGLDLKHGSRPQGDGHTQPASG